MATTKPLFFTTALLLFVGMAMVNIQRAEAGCGGFKTTCSAFDIMENGVLSARCNNQIGRPSDSSIDLNKYIGNINGNMIVPGLDFSGNCKSLGLSYGIGGNEFFVLGGCTQDNGAISLAAYDINYHISNDNGILNWNPCREN